ncbi:hypothetical protein BaRGS_00014843 [Batillaria attramentaria]|uniref:Uncharacterized protein n=1 Tax=Batillaria attramentaria TaxID=370345 RepID=A0ABD0L352_9CAEN
MSRRTRRELPQSRQLRAVYRYGLVPPQAALPPLCGSRFDPLDRIGTKRRQPVIRAACFLSINPGNIRRAPCAAPSAWGSGVRQARQAADGGSGDRTTADRIRGTEPRQGRLPCLCQKCQPHVTRRDHNCPGAGDKAVPADRCWNPGRHAPRYHNNSPCPPSSNTPSSPPLFFLWQRCQK